MKATKENVSPSKKPGTCQSLIKLLVRPEEAPFLESLSLQPPDDSHKIEKLEGLERFVNLTELDLKGNHITDPSELVKLSKTLPNLQRLYISGNPVANIKDIEDFCIKHFPTLTYFNGKPVDNKQKALQDENAKLLKENKKLLAEVTELKSHNQKLSEELAYKSKLLINKSKDITKNNEKLVELEQELALYKLESISMCTPSKVVEQDYSNENIRTGARSAEDFFASKRNKASPTKELRIEIANLNQRKMELMAAIDKTKGKLKQFEQEKFSIEKNEREYYFDKIIQEDKLNCNKNRLEELLEYSEQLRKQSINIQEEIHTLKKSVEAKNEHLVVLRKQMAERAVESILSDTEGFLMEEEKASHEELLELEEKLREKEKEYDEVIAELEKTTIKTKRLKKEEEGVSWMEAGILQTMPDAEFHSKSFASHCRKSSVGQFRNRSSELRRGVSLVPYQSSIKAFEQSKSKISQDIMYAHCNLFNNNRKYKRELEVLNRSLKELEELINEREQELDKSSAEPNSIFKAIQDLVLTFAKGLKENDPDIELSLQKPEEVLSSDKFIEWLKECFEFIKNAIKEKIKLADLDERTKKKSAEYREKSRMLRQVLNQLETAKSEKLVIEKSCVPIRIEEQKFIEQIIKRAIKLSHFVCDSHTPVKYPNPTGECWKFLDFFTKQMRAYIRRAEESKARLYELKREKGKFIGYIEKEVNELARSWNLMEEEKIKISQMVQKVVEKEHSLAQEELSKKRVLEAEVQELEQRKMELVQETQFVKNATEEQKESLEKEIDAYNAEIDALKAEMNSLAEGKNRLVEVLEGIRTEYEIVQGELEDLKREQCEVKGDIVKLELRRDELKEGVNNNNDSTEEKRLLELNQIIEEREKILTEINEEIMIREEEALQCKYKVKKYKDKMEGLKTELKTLQSFSDTRMFSYNN